MGVQRRIVAVLVVTQIVGSLGIGAGLTIGTLLVKEITGSSGWAGMATVVGVIGAALVTVPLATLAARRGRRPALTLGWIIATAGAALSVRASVADSLPLVLLGLCLFGSATAANLQSRFAAVDRADPSTVGQSLSLVVWSSTLGAVVGPNLVGPGASVAQRFGVPDLAGPMLFSLAGFALAAIMTFALLRPDPLAGTFHPEEVHPSMRSALPHVRGPVALAIYATATAHAIMVAVMSLTPIHMQDHGAELKIIGITISIHIAGMFALSPLMGWLSDQLGPRPVILAGQLLLIAAVSVWVWLDSHTQITIGLALLGLGWSATVIAGASMLTGSTDEPVRPLVQGISDFTMHVAGASGGLLAGIVVATRGYETLNAVAGLLTIPVIVAIAMRSTAKVPV